MQLAQHAPDSSSVRLLNNLSEWLQYYEDGEALGFAENAYQLAREWKDTLGQAIAARNRCSILHGLAVDDQAILFGLESLDLLSKLDAPAEFAVSQMAVGIVYAEMKEQGAALARFELAEKLFRSIGAAGDARLAQHNRAIIFSDRGDFAQALQLFRDNLAAVEFTEEPYFLAATYNNIGTIYNRKARWDSAAYYFKKAIELKRDLPNKGSKANSHNNLALAMLELGDFKGAQNHLDSALAYALESGEQGREMEIYETRAKLNEALGDFQASVNDLKSVLTLRDTLHSSESALHVSQLSAFYVADAQKDEIELLNKQQEIDAKEKVIFRWLICSLLLVLLLVGGFLALAAKRSRERIRSNNELRGKNEEIERQKQEILVQNEALSEKIEHLAELNREKDGLIGIVAHDIRAPLNRSAALAELVAATGSLNDEQTKFLNMIQKVSDDGASLIQDLLELNVYERKCARIDFQKVDIHELVAASVHGFRAALARKQMKLEVNKDVKPLVAVTDEKLLTRILDNLLSNAVKFSLAGKRIFLNVQSQNGQVFLSVRDEGPGMSEEDQSKMFRKFQRLTARPTGGETSTGLGLSIIKTLVERLEGQVQVKSELGVGTEFLISIPLIRKVQTDVDFIKERAEQCV